MSALWLLVFVLSSVSFSSAATRTVNISNFAFTDAVSNNSTTVINAGDTVQWNWQSGTHSTTSGTCSGPGTCTPSGTWDSTILSSPNTFSFAFNNDGSFPYYCRVHTTSMLGKVIVNPVVTNTNDSGPGSLRQAILDFNTDPDLTAITFNIPGGGIQTITPLSALPVMNHSGILDGTTQPGWAANAPLIELNGAGAGASVVGLSIQAGSTTVRGLIIHSFSQDGIVLQSGNNVITGNFIGTNAAGTAAAGNGGNGVLIGSGEFNNIIGGTTAATRNVISGNSLFGVEVSGLGTTGNMVEGNFIGTDVNGAAALANSSGGVRIQSGASNNTVGGMAAGAGNVISGNTVSNLSMSGSGTTGNVVEGNFIGINAAGTGFVSFAATMGVFIQSGAANNTVGGTSAAARNVISGNLNGVDIDGSGTTGNLVEGNYIGTDVTGTSSLQNGTGVVLANNVANNTIGGTSAGSGNLISGNPSAAVKISAASNNLVEGNLIGTDLTGNSRIANGIGIFVNAAATNNTIGGTSPGARNVISGNSADAIHLDGTGTSGNLVQGNFLGTNSAGTVGMANSSGVLITGGAINNTIGGTAPGARNVISGNADGIGLTNGVNTVQGNFIGTDVTGTVAIGNIDTGIRLGGVSNNVIGGTAPGAGNVISGSGQYGIDIYSNSFANTIQGNLIGTNAAGTAAIRNSFDGVRIETGANGNTIGGTTAGAANTISGNGGSGIDINGIGTNGNIVQGNFIGTAILGAGPLANHIDGVRIENSASANIIGGTAAGAGNTIAFNPKGVVVTSNTAVRNAIEGNAIFSNTGLGIDLNDDGVTSNTPGGPHTGPNNLQNYPVLTSVMFNSNNANINGTLNSAASTAFRLEFFSNAACDASGHGQGRSFLGFQNVSTDGSGNASFSASFSTINPSISATATDPVGNTSEFSACGLADAPLTNVAGRNLRVRLGKPFTFVVASFTDTDPSGSASQFTNTTIDWGDGTTPSTATIVSTGGQNYNVVGTHAYTKVGGWNVTVTINDSGGATATATSKARLWPKPLSF